MDKDFLMLAASIGGAYISYKHITEARALKISNPALALEKTRLGVITGAASVAASLYGGFKALKKMT